MKSSQISKILKKKFIRINNSLKKTVEHFDSKKIQLFSEEIQKLKAFLFLLDSGADNSRLLTLPKKLDRFYNEVVLARTLQLERKGIRKAVLKAKRSTLPKEYLQKLKDNIKSSLKYAKSLSKRKASFKSEEMQLVRMAPNKITQSTIREFAWNEVSTLKGLFGSLYTSDESLLAIRNLFQNLLYVWPIIKGEISTILPSAIFCSKADLRFITKRLGKFQDVSASLTLLSTYDARETRDENERLFLIGLDKKWTIERDTLRAEIHKLFKNRIPAFQGFALLTDGNHSAVKSRLLAR